MTSLLHNTPQLYSTASSKFIFRIHLIDFCTTNDGVHDTSNVHIGLWDHLDRGIFKYSSCFIARCHNLTLGCRQV